MIQVKRWALIGARGHQEMDPASNASRECGFPEYVLASDYDREMTKADHTIQSLKQQLEKANTMVSELTQERAEIKKRREEEGAIIAKKDAEIADLKAKVERYFKMVQLLDEACLKYDPEYLDTPATNVVEGAIVSVARLADTRDELETARAEIAKLRTDRTHTLCMACGEKGVRSNGLNTLDELAAARAEIAALEQQVEDAQKYIEHFESAALESKASADKGGGV